MPTPKTVAGGVRAKEKQDAARTTPVTRGWRGCRRASSRTIAGCSRTVDSSATIVSGAITSALWPITVIPYSRADRTLVNSVTTAIQAKLAMLNANPALYEALVQLEP